MQAYHMLKFYKQLAWHLPHVETRDEVTMHQALVILSAPCDAVQVANGYTIPCNPIEIIVQINHTLGLFRMWYEVQERGAHVALLILKIV